MKKLLLLTFLVTLSACAVQQQKKPCIDYSERRAKYVRLYTRDEITVRDFILLNEDLELLSEMGAIDCKVEQ